VHTFKNASETEDCECYMTATPGRYLFWRVGDVADLMGGGRALCGL